MSKEHSTPYLATISNPRQIHDLPCNTSHSKQLYSFSKANRFPDALYKPNCSLAFYDVNPTLYRSQRFTQFKGCNRSDFTAQCENTPPPDTYDVKNFTIGRKGHGISFGKSRADCKDLQSLINRDLARVPGPGTYDMPDPKKAGRNFSFKLRTKAVDWQRVDVGPGQYNVPETINAKTFNFNSKFKNVGTAKIMPMSQAKRRVPRSASQPAFYDLKTDINVRGNYYSSKFKNSMCRSFGKALREGKRIPSAKPGPGTYRSPSEFGLYLSSRVNKK